MHKTSFSAGTPPEPLGSLRRFPDLLGWGLPHSPPLNAFGVSKYVERFQRPPFTNS